MSINSITISGNLGRDAELKTTQNGTSVLSFSVCVNTRMKKGDSWVDQPNWVPCTMFGRRADALARHLTKGSKVAVSGSIREERWEAKDGTSRSRLSVIVDELEFTGHRMPAQEKPADEDDGAYAGEDIPF